MLSSKGESDPNKLSIKEKGIIADIEKHKKAEKRLAAQYAVTRILSEGLHVEDTFPKVLQAICTHLNWEFGGIWMVDPQNNYIQNISLWHISLPNIEEFESRTRALKFNSGEGLPGRVWSTGKPAWINNILVDKNYPRAPYAEKAGLHAAFGFPIMLGNRLLGVLEIYTRSFEQPDEPLLDMLASLGPQIGQFIERRKAENELHESEEFKRVILESALDSIITLDLEGKILSFNPETERMFNCSKEDLEHKNIDIFIPGLFAKLSEFDEKGTREFMGVPISKDPIPLEITISKTSSTKKKMIVCIVRDITERKKIEKMKTEFISVVSHELRTPLTSIKGSLGLLLGRYNDTFPEKIKQLLNIAQNNCDRLIRLINDILDIEKIEHGKMVFNFNTMNVKKLLEEAVDANFEFANKFNVKLTLKNISDVFISGDYDRLMQVVTNLLSNAIKFSGQSGEVIVEMASTKDNVRISVQDHGKGIPEEFRSKVFNKFAQADGSSQRGVSGTGLGLNICKAIIEQHQGVINFVTAEGEGTTFYCDLPLIKEPLEKPSEAEALLIPLAKASGRILVCEDDKDCASLIKMMLEEKNFVVDVAYNAAEAKKFLSTTKYAALTLDLMLPDQNGIALIKELQTQEEFKKLPIVVISAIAKQGKDELKGNAFPVVDWIDKPINENKLYKLIDDIKEQQPESQFYVLHVEDNPDVATITSNLLADTNIHVISARTLASAREWLAKEAFDLVLLDLNLPDGSGADLLPCINWQTRKVIPVVVFSAYDLDQEYAKYVYTTLMKSTTTNEKFIATINNAIHQH